jgi:hypothetical protein
MPFASKSQQRLERSTNVVAADKVVTSLDKPEMNRMPQDKSNLMGGRIARGGEKTKLMGSMGVKSKGSTLFGSMGKDGGSTGKNGKTMTSNSSYSKSGTTREKIGGKQSIDP